MKIASTKKEMPSSPKATPNTSPKVAMKSGHSSPNSKERTVPVTTPTAKRISATFDQRCRQGLASGEEPRREAVLERRQPVHAQAGALAEEEPGVDAGGGKVGLVEASVEPPRGRPCELQGGAAQRTAIPAT